MNPNPNPPSRIDYADDTRESVGHLLRLRIPWLFLGLLGGMVASVIVSEFEDVLIRTLELAFFLPVIVYMSDAIGTQTETIYVRSLAKGKPRLLTYLLKESALGLTLGIVFGLVLGLFAYWWIGSTTVAVTVGLAMLLNSAIAPIIALLIPAIIFKERRDPAIGAGPFATVIQDNISLVIYFLVASAVLFS